MIDRRATVTPLDGGRYEIEGVAYVAGVPNVNGVVYTKEALEEAFPRFMDQEYRPVTIGCAVEPKLETWVGEVTGWSVDGDVFSVKVKTYPLERVKGWVKAAADSIALAGACQAGPLDIKRVVTIEKLISFGLVTVDTVTPDGNGDE